MYAVSTMLGAHCECCNALLMWWRPNVCEKSSPDKLDDDNDSKVSCTGVSDTMQSNSSLKRSNANGVSLVPLLQKKFHISSDSTICSLHCTFAW